MGNLHAFRKDSRDSIVTRILEFWGKTPPPPMGEKRRAANTGFPSLLGCLFWGMSPSPCGSRQDSGSWLGSEARVATWQPPQALSSGPPWPRWPLSGCGPSVGTLTSPPRKTRVGTGARAPSSGSTAECRRGVPSARRSALECGGERTPFHFLPLTAGPLFPRQCKQARGAPSFLSPCSGPQVPAALGALRMAFLFLFFSLLFVAVQDFLFRITSKAQ